MIAQVVLFVHGFFRKSGVVTHTVDCRKTLVRTADQWGCAQFMQSSGWKPSRCCWACTWRRAVVLENPLYW